MTKITIKLDNIELVKKFSNLVARFDPEMDLLTGRYIIDAKSIMGILSLDLAEPIKMVIHSDDCEELLESLKEFIVED